MAAVVIAETAVVAVALLIMDYSGRPTTSFRWLVMVTLFGFATRGGHAGCSLAVIGTQMMTEARGCLTPLDVNVFLTFVTLPHVDALFTSLTRGKPASCARKRPYARESGILRENTLLGGQQSPATSRSAEPCVSASQPHGSLPKLERAVQGASEARPLNCPACGTLC